MATSMLLAQGVTPQLAPNESSQFLEFAVSYNDHEALKQRLIQLNFELEEGHVIQGSGTFTHFVTGIAPVRVYYKIKVRDGNLMFSNFEVASGNQPKSHIEAIPAKGQKRWTRLINEELHKLLCLINN